MFLHDDRAPHGLFMVCKRWYQQQMAAHLQDTEIFQEDPRPWKDTAAELSQELKRLGFQAGTGILYNYGIWKPKKGKFRFIAGTRSHPPDEGQSQANQAGGKVRQPKKEPPRSPTYHLSKSLVKVLDQVGKTLQALDERRQRESGVRCYWPILSVNDFTRLVRSHADEIVRQGMETYDFSTMYTSFDQHTILNNVMEAFREAQQEAASLCPQAQTCLASRRKDGSSERAGVQTKFGTCYG